MLPSRSVSVELEVPETFGNFRTLKTVDKKFGEKQGIYRKKKV
jgi:hypothetical protein